MTTASIGEIARAVSGLGVRRGGVLLVHCSLRALGPLAGVADAVIAALREALGGSGTLLMPALSYRSVTPANPVFDLMRTPSCVGWLAERYRTAGSDLRSLHPTHSVCASGPLARELCRDHILDTTPCGPRSPFARLREADGQILFLGCGMGPNTSMHAIEEVAGAPHIVGPWIDYRLIHPAVEPRSARIRSHPDFHQAYGRVEPLLGDACRRGRVLDAACHLVAARVLWDAALTAYARDFFCFTPSERP